MTEKHKNETKDDIIVNRDLDALLEVKINEIPKKKILSYIDCTKGKD